MKEFKMLHKIAPYAVVILLFLGVTMVYFAPQYQGKTISMHDITQYHGMGKDMSEHSQKYGEDPQWAGRMFSGMPAYLIGIKFDATILKSVRKVVEFIGFPSALIFVSMLTFFLMLVLCGINPWVGIVPSLAYGLSTYFFIIIVAGHATKMVALAYVPLLLGGVFYTYRKNMWLGAALTALAGSIEIAAGHPQITYYFALIILAFFINELVQAIKKHLLPRFVKASGLLLVAALLAVASNLGPLWYTQNHSKETTRGGSELHDELLAKGEQSQKRGGGLDIDYATQWSYGRTESLNMLIPNLMGGESSGGFSDDGEVAQSLTKYNARKLATQLPAYWGDQPMTAGPTYIGAVIIFLAVMGLFLLDGRKKWWLIAVSGVALLLSWGNNFMWFTELFFYYFPGYNKFRTVSMILVILEWSVPFVAALMLNKVWKQEVDRAKFIKALKYSIYITGGVTLLLALFGGAIFNFESPVDGQMKLPDDVLTAMRAERASMLTSDSWRSLIYILLTAGVVLMFGLGKIKKWALITLLSVLVCADLVAINLRYLPQSKFVEPSTTSIKPSKADIQILEDKEPGFRVANFAVSTFNDASTSYFHRSVGGYHGAKLQRYQDIIERHLGKMNWNVYNMLNTKYIISPDQQTGEPTVQLNPDANGAAWFVSQIELADSPNAEIDALNTIDTKRSAVVDRKFEKALSSVDLGALASDSTARVELIDYKPNHLSYKYSAPKQGVIVFSEIFYDKGWDAYLDGQKCDYFRANYILRAMVVPAGEHSIEFRFRAPNFALLSNITLISSLIIIAWLLVTVIIVIIKKRNGKPRE